MRSAISTTAAIAAVLIGASMQANASHVTPAKHTEPMKDVHHTQKMVDVRHTKPRPAKATKRIAKNSAGTSASHPGNSKPSGTQTAGGLNQAQIDAYRSINQSIFNAYNDGGYKYQGWQFGR